MTKRAMLTIIEHCYQCDYHDDRPDEKNEGEMIHFCAKVKKDFKWDYQDDYGRVPIPKWCPRDKARK